MKILRIIVALALLCADAEAFFESLTTEQRIAASTVIAIIHVTKVDDESGFSEATVINGLYGIGAKEVIKIWDDVTIDKDGKEWTYNGRDAYLEVGKRYFIYLKKNKAGKLVTVQSSLDSLEVIGKTVEKEDGDGFEALDAKVSRTKKLIVKQKEAEQGGADQPATAGDSKAEGKREAKSKSEGRPQ